MNYLVGVCNACVRGLNDPRYFYLPPVVIEYAIDRLLSNIFCKGTLLSAFQQNSTKIRDSVIRHALYYWTREINQFKYTQLWPWVEIELTTINQMQFHCAIKANIFNDF